MECAAKMTEVAVNHTERFQTVHSVLKCRIDAESSRKELATDLSEALVAANIPVEKLDHPAIRRFLEKRVPGAGAIPTANRIRQWYLPTLQKAHNAELYKILSQADGIILTVDESSDNVTECSVLNLVMTPIVADKASYSPRRSDLPGQDRSQSGGSRSHESYQQVRRQTQPCPRLHHRQCRLHDQILHLVQCVL